jgi:hypothetical protein
MRIGTTVNLETGGRYDLLVLTYPEGFPTGTVLPEMDKTPRRISGVQKVAQTFLRMFITSKGSDVLHNIGTDFQSISASPTSSRIKSLIKDYVEVAATRTKEILNSPRADVNSQLDRVEVTSMNTTRDGIDLRVRIITKGGESAPIALPFTSAGIS